MIRRGSRGAPPPHRGASPTHVPPDPRSLLLAPTFKFHHAPFSKGEAMKDLFRPDQRRELAGRGFSRRDFARLAALMSAGASLPFYNEPALAQGLSAFPGMPTYAVRINANENPMGPCPEAAEAIAKVIQQGGR